MTVEERVTRLERENSRLRRGRIIVLVIASGLAVMGQAAPRSVPDVIRAKKFEVIGDNGRLIARLGRGVFQDYGALSIFDSNEELKASIFASTVGGVIFTANRKGRTVVSIGPDEAGNGSISTFNGKGKEAVRISTTTTGKETISTHNSKGERLVSISSTNKGDGAITANNGKGKKLLQITANRSGDGAISTHSSKGEKLFQISSTKGGEAGIATFNRAGKVRAVWPR